MTGWIVRSKLSYAKKKQKKRKKKKERKKTSPNFCLQPYQKKTNQKKPLPFFFFVPLGQFGGFFLENGEEVVFYYIVFVYLFEIVDVQTGHVYILLSPTRSAREKMIGLVLE